MTEIGMGLSNSLEGNRVSQNPNKQQTNKTKTKNETNKRTNKAKQKQNKQTSKQKNKSKIIIQISGTVGFPLPGVQAKVVNENNETSNIYTSENRFYEKENVSVGDLRIKGNLFNLFILFFLLFWFYFFLILLFLIFSLLFIVSNRTYCISRILE
jgi:hypothetical protein